MQKEEENGENSLTTSNRTILRSGRRSNNRYAPSPSGDVLTELLLPLVLVLENSLDGGPLKHAGVPLVSVGELSGEVEVGTEELGDSVVGVFDEGEVGNGALVSNKPFLLAQDVVEDAQDTPDLVLVPLDGGGKLLWVVVHEPLGLSEVGALSGSLEEEPLFGLVLAFLVVVSDGDLVFLVVLGDEVLQDGVGLPDGEIVVLVVDESRNLAIWVEVQVGSRLLLLVDEVHVNIVISQPEFFKGEAKLPLVHATVVVVESKLFGVGSHDSRRESVAEINLSRG